MKVNLAKFGQQLQSVHQWTAEQVDAFFDFCHDVSAFADKQKPTLAEVQAALKLFTEQKHDLAT